MLVELGGCRSCGAEAEKRLVVLQAALRELVLVRLVQEKLQVLRVLRASARRLEVLSWAERAEQLGVQQLELERAPWLEQVRWLATKLCKGAWRGELRAKKPEARFQDKSKVGMHPVTAMSMDREAFRRAKDRSSSAMKAKVKISGAAEIAILGLVVEMEEEWEEAEEAEKEVAEDFSPGCGVSSLVNEDKFATALF
jgi:hypothetical protein